MIVFSTSHSGVQLPHMIRLPYAISYTHPRPTIRIILFEDSTLHSTVRRKDEPKELVVGSVYFPFKLTPFTLLANCIESKSEPNEGWCRRRCSAITPPDIEEFKERFWGRSPDSLRIVSSVAQPPECCSCRPSDWSCSAATLQR